MITELTQKDIGRVILSEGQFAIQINYIQDYMTKAKVFNDGSQSFSIKKYRYSDDGTGWYTLSNTDVWKIN